MSILTGILRKGKPLSLDTQAITDPFAVQRAFTVVSVILTGFGLTLLFPGVYGGARVASLAPMALHALLLSAVVSSRPAKIALFLPVAMLPWVSAAWQIAALSSVQLVIAFRASRPPWSQWIGNSLTIALVTAIVFFWESTGLLWAELSRFCWWATGHLTQLFSTPQWLGPSQVALPWLVILLLAGVARAVAQGEHLWVRLAILTFTLLAATASLSLSQPLLAIICAAAVTTSYQPQQEESRLTKPALIAGNLAIGLAFLLLFALNSMWPSRGDAPRVAAFLAPGLGTNIVQEAWPSSSTEPADARFGLLPRILRKYGWEIRQISRAELATSLNDVSVLCVPNPRSSPSPQEQLAIHRFLQAGNAMLVLGDHTDIGHIRKPLNDFLQATSIRFNYDCAIDYVPDGRWTCGLRGAMQPSFWGATNQDFHISVGASLATADAAKVLVNGDRGFSDKGDSTTGISQLGDMTYNPGERLGGVTLAAEEQVGNGRVVVFGDTSGFQDATVSFDHRWVAGFFDNLRSRRAIFPNSPKSLAVLTLLAALVGTFLLRRAPIFPLAWLAVGFASLALAAWTPVPRTPDLRNTVAIDMSHLPRVQTPNEGTELFRFTETITRSGSISLKLSDFDEMLGAAPPRIVILAPGEGYTAQEAEKLRSYVEQGGRLYISANWANKSTVGEIAKVFNVGLKSNQLGIALASRIVDRDLKQRVGIQFALSATEPEITFRHANPMEGEGWVPLVTCWGEILCARKNLGKGFVVWLCDDAFFTDANLGGSNKVNVADIRFAIQILEW